MSEPGKGMMASITGIYYGLDEPKLTLMREQAFAQIEPLRTGKRFSSVGGRGGRSRGSGVSRRTDGRHSQRTT